MKSYSYKIVILFLIHLSLGMSNEKEKTEESIIKKYLKSQHA
jgi:hypothetical protein